MSRRGLAILAFGPSSPPAERRKGKNSGPYAADRRHRMRRQFVLLMARSLVLTGLLSAMVPGAGVAQPAAGLGRPLDAAARNAVIDGLIRQLNKIYIFPDVARKMEAAIRARQSRKEYDSITSGTELAELLTEHLRQVRYDSHLSVEYSATGTSYDSEKPPTAEEIARFREKARLRNYEYRKVERLDGGIGLLQIDGFYPDEWSQDTVVAALGFLANSEALILDFRQNHGGAGSSLLASYFFEDATHLNDYYNRAQRTTRQYWTYPVVPGKKLADKDLYILISKQTVSAPEALARDMQYLKRATVVGEETPGGANPTTMFRITDNFRAGIPFARAIHAGISPEAENAGVKPDIAVPASQALLTAHLMALEKSLRKHMDEPELAASLRRTIAQKEQELEAVKTSKTPTP